MTPEERERDEYAAAERLCAIRHASIEERLDAMWGRIDDRFDAQEKATAQAMKAATTASDKAEGLAAERFKVQNEFRDTITDLVTVMTNAALPRTEYEVKHGILVEKISEMRERSASNRLQTLILTGLMTAIFSMLVYLVAIHLG